ncbi:hypothetical protein WJX79_005555 [Trebouxia sp. C0005]
MFWSLTGTYSSRKRSKKAEDHNQRGKETSEFGRPCLKNTNDGFGADDRAREVLSPCFTVRNYSSRCRPQLVGLSEHVIIKQVLESPKGDDCYVHLLKNKYELEGGSCLRARREILWDKEFAKKLDQNPDFLAVKNGVIDLVTGDIRQGQPSDYVSKAIETEYLGLDYPCRNIQDFFNSIFDDQHMVEYVQRLLGYGITGHTREQKFVIMTGVGSNGKGVLYQILDSLLSGWAKKPMDPDCILKRGRPSGKGAATPYLSQLAGARIAICDEVGDDPVLDEEIVKRMTGESTMTARALYSNPVDFKATHLPILLSNCLPKININDAAILRRLVVVPFAMIFKQEADIDCENPSHKVMDKSLGKQLATIECRQQLLTWLVQGAVAWQRDGLGGLPKKMKDAMKSYVAENDLLQEFLDEDCDVGADYEAMTTRFYALFIKKKGRVSDKELAKMMEARGFTKKITRSFPQRAMKWQGVRIRDIDQDVQQNVEFLHDDDDDE